MSNINDLGITTALETGDKLLVRKSGANYDTSITKQNVAKSLGNTAAIGFIATSDTANKIILTPTNGAVLDAYYDQMLVTFISPITSNAAVQIKINGLGYKNIVVNGNSIETAAGDYIEAYYSLADDEFKQSNNIEATLYTSEFTAVNSTVSGNTLITLTSAVGNAKEAYYNGMLVTFVNPANTLAGINVNVDGLGAVPLEVRTATGYIIPANTIVTAVYATDRFICNKSIQGTSLDLYGYIASSSAANQVQLNSVSGVTGSNYVTGMRVSFVSPITTNAATQLKLPGMAFKSFYKYGSAENKPLITNNFYEAVYIGDAATGNFYETNATTDTIYTNEYTATAVVAGDNSSTTYTLTSAIGIPKPAYYNAMSILFTSPVDSKGDQIVNVDGLGNKVLDDNDIENDDISTGDAIMAIYDGTKFIKHRFSNAEDPTPTPIPDIIVNVGTGGDFTTIQLALNAIIRDYGITGGGRNAVIQLLSNYVWADAIEINFDLSWITIKSDAGGNNITVVKAVTIKKGKNFGIEGIFRLTFNSSGSGSSERCLLFIPSDMLVSDPLSFTFNNLEVFFGDSAVFPTSNAIIVFGTYNQANNFVVSDVTFNNCKVTLKTAEVSNTTGSIIIAYCREIRNVSINNSIIYSFFPPYTGAPNQPIIYFSGATPVYGNISILNSQHFSNGTAVNNYFSALLFPIRFISITFKNFISNVGINFTIQTSMPGIPITNITFEQCIILNSDVPSAASVRLAALTPYTGTIKGIFIGGNYPNSGAAGIFASGNTNIFLYQDSSGNYPVGFKQAAPPATITQI